MSKPTPRGSTSRSRLRAAPRPRRRGGATKISITVDSGVLLETRRLVRKTGATLSAHVTETLARELRRQRLQQVIAEYEAEHGEITEQELAEVRAQWQA